MTASRRRQTVRDTSTTPEIIYYEMAYLASLVLDPKTSKPYTTRRMRRWLLREGACYLMGGRYVATAETLVTNFPDILNKIRRDGA